MKTRTSVLLACLTLCMLQATAQEKVPPLNNPNYNKARIFSDLPDRMALRLHDAEELLDLPVGAKVNATVASGLPIVGTVVSKSNPADTSVRSVVIQTTRQGATFTFSRIRGAGGTVSYIGRMLNRSGGDALEIAKEGQGYVIKKKGIYDLLNE
jgi:hypothetical protein